MMNPFPAEHELIAFFECEPELLDNTRGIPWFYNRLTFASTRGEDRFRFVLEPADEILQLRWERGGVEVVELDLNWVSGLEVEMRNGRERLIAQFRNAAIGPLVIQLKPCLHISWSTPVQSHDGTRG